MVSMLYDRNGVPIENYATLRRKGQTEQFLTAGEFLFEPGPEKWISPITQTSYRTNWRLAIPAESIDISLKSKNSKSEFLGKLLPVAYWESAVNVTDFASGEPQGKGFIELNWAPGRNRG